jgi:hypothetical protein
MTLDVQVKQSEGDKDSKVDGIDYGKVARAAAPKLPTLCFVVLA